MEIKQYTVKRYDGFGSQYHGFMAGIAYCEFNKDKYTYVHSPIIKIGHLPMITNIDRLNKFIGIPYEVNNTPIDIYEDYPKDVHECPNANLYYTPSVIDTLRRYYFSEKKPEIVQNDIAIHIRRGDVTPEYTTRYTPNIFYAHLILKLKSMFPYFSIHIHSEGVEEDFSELRIDNVHFHLNEDIEVTFHSLVTAKVLVTSKSSFSFTAAVLNSGIVIYMPFWHIPLQNWHILQ